MRKRAVSFALCMILCIGVLPGGAFAAGRDVSFEETLAAELKSLGLFRGVSDTNFDLARSPTRIEALIMLIRTLGKEQEALAGTWEHPFDDVPAWADKYVGYAYQNALTKGTSATTFGAGDASAAQYLTFILRALGYSDAGGADFSWDSPYELSGSAGILPDGTNLSEFWRADVVRISYAALGAKRKGSDQTLAQKLIAAGAFTQAQFDESWRADAFAEQNAPRPGTTALSAREISDLASPAVFFVQVYDTESAASDPAAVGSGFLISADGTAVTNYHVIEETLGATATTSDGKVYPIEKVLFYDVGRDIAVVRLSRTARDGTTCAAFPFLRMRESAEVRNGDVVYAIGSPLGLQNSISNGIVSNRSRTLEGESYPYIQTTAAISHGSSGGALVNEYGEAVGVTAGYLGGGQNLNLAIPMDSVLGLDLSAAGTPYADVYRNEFRRLLREDNPDIGEREWEERSAAAEESYEPIDSGDTFYGMFAAYHDLDYYWFTTPVPVDLTVAASALAGKEAGAELDAFMRENYGMTWDTYVRESLAIIVYDDSDRMVAFSNTEYGGNGTPIQYIDHVRLEPGTYYLCALQQLDDEDLWALGWDGREYFIYLYLEEP